MASIGDVIRFIVTADGQPFRDDIVKDEAAVKALDSSARDAGGSGGGMGMLGASIMGLLPLLSPLTASAGGALIGLAGMATTAGAGFVGLGLVAKSNLSDIFQAQKVITAQQKAYNNAVNNKQRQAAMLKAKQAWDTLDTSQQKALTSLQGFDKFWKGFTKQFESPVLNMFTNGLTMVQRLLTLMGPTISAAGGAFSKLEADASKALGSPFWAQFFKWMSKDTASSINSIGVSIGNIMKGLAGMFMAFSPGQKSMEQGLINLTKRFADWGASLGSNSGFQKFVEYFNKQGPKVMSLLDQLSTLIVNLLVGMAPVGSVMLSIITTLASWINKLITLNPLIGELVAAIIPAIGIFKLGAVAVAGISTAIGIATKVFGILQRVLIVGIRLIGLAFETNPIILVITGIIAVIALAAFEIHKHWTAIRTFLESTWKAISNGARKLGSDISNFFKSLGKEAISWGENLIKMFASGITNSIHWVESAVSNVAGRLKHWLGFHSPSAGLPDSGEWAPNFMRMFAAGIDANRPLVDQAMQKTTAHMQSEAAKQQKIAQSMQQKEQSMFSRMQSIYSNYAQTMTNLRTNYQKQVQAINDNLIKQEDALNQKYKQALDNRTQQLQQSFGLFSQVTHKQVSAQSLLGDIQDQVSTFEGWTNDLQALTKRGVDQGLIAELQKAGPQSADEVKALASMTNDQLNKYVSLWQQQAKDARTEATNELAPMKQDTENQIEALKVAADEKLQQLTETFDQNAANARTKFENQLAQLAKSAPKAIASAIDKMQQQLDSKMNTLVTSATQWASKLASALSGTTLSSSLSSSTINMIQQNGMSGVASAVAGAIGAVHMPVNINVNAPVYGVNDLNAAIAQGVQQHVVPALQQVLTQPARAITGAR